MRHRVTLAAATLAFALACSSESPRVVAAQQVSYSSTLAARGLRQGFWTRPQEEDEADARLLHAVEALDRADQELPDQVRQFERLKSENSGQRAVSRLEILATLDTIEADLAEVHRDILDRPVHESVRESLQRVPAALATVRELMSGD